MQTLGFDVTGMICGGCTGSMQRALSKLEGVIHVEVTLRPGTITMQVDVDRVTPGQIEKTVADLGYSAKLKAALGGGQVTN